MIEYKGIYLPDGETHLIEWMEKRNEIVKGKPTYQYHKLRAAVDLCPPDRRRRAIDVGAHCGLWSMHLADEFAAVVAFEPLEAHRACFYLNVTNGAVELWPNALGDSDPIEIDMTTDPTSSGDTRVREAGSIAKSSGVVELRRLDGWRFDHVDFIKIDCEGYELPVLRGATETILHHRPVICVEQKPKHAQRYGFAETEAVAWLEKQHGYRVAKILSGDYMMVPE